jgi:ABC-2 type transport system permease protein
MRNFAAVFKKELRTYFTSPIAYVVIIIFLILAGFFFYSGYAYFNLISFQAMRSAQTMVGVNVIDWVLRPLLGNISVFFMLLMPLLTMRLFSEEKKTGTIELLFTYPIRDSELLLGKYIACLTVFLLMLGLTFIYPLMMHLFGTLPWGPVLTGYLGLVLLGAAFIALGIFASSLTENQIVAAVLAFGALLFFWVIGWAANFAPIKVGKVLTQISLLEHFDNFAKGIIDTKDIVYYITLILFFLFITLRSLESKKWRG